MEISLPHVVDDEGLVAYSTIENEDNTMDSTVILDGKAATALEHDAHVAQPARVMNWWKLAALSYVTVCGGPFGMETAVNAAGALPTLIMIGVLAVFWALPQALMTAEMSTIFSVNGGYIVVSNVCFLVACVVF